MKNYSELFVHVSTFFTNIKPQFNIPIQILQSNNAKKYLSESFQTYMTQHLVILIFFRDISP